MGEAQEVGKVVVFSSGDYEKSEKRHLLEGELKEGKMGLQDSATWCRIRDP